MVLKRDDRGGIEGMRKVAAIVTSLALCAATAGAEDFWVKKEWKDWSKGEVKKMLEDSPWSKTWSIGEVRRSEVRESSSGTGRETTPRIYYAIQLRSALPVRQAVVRDVQIQNKYDSLPAEQKRSLDESAQAYLAKDYADVIVVHVVFWSNVQAYERQLAEFWGKVTKPENTKLITSRGRIIEPLRYVAPPQGRYEFELIFPRRAGGEDIITASDKSLRVEFPHPNIGTGSETNQDRNLAETDRTGAKVDIISGQRVTAEFKVEKLHFKGKLAI
jgi:hypothetical protein